MCWPRRKIPTNENGQATKLWLCHCQAIQIRVFHITWFTFWLCFYGWFATANLYPQIAEDLGLTDKDRAWAGGASVVSTIIFRVIIGWLCDKIGAKKCYISLLIISVFPVCGMSLVHNNIGYIVVSLFIGIVGASFVITQYHTTAMFAGKTVGAANATAAGWGNFGGGCANFFMPLLYNHFIKTYHLSSSQSWRVCMLVPGLMYIVMAVIYYFFTVDNPPNIKTDYVSKTKQQNKSGGFKIGAMDYRTWILCLVYTSVFGIELTVLRFAVGFFMDEFDLEQQIAGLIILCFSFCNLFARSIGGIISDFAARKYAKKSLQGRVMSLFGLLLMESIFLICFSFGSDLVDSLGYTIFMLIAFTLCVQAAGGVTFSIVPFVQPDAIGVVAGIVAAGANLGAMIFAFAIFSFVPHSLSYVHAWLILGIFVFFVSFSTLFMRFSDDENKAAIKKMRTFRQIDKRANQMTGNIAFQKVTTNEVNEEENDSSINSWPPPG